MKDGPVLTRSREGLEAAEEDEDEADVDADEDGGIASTARFIASSESLATELEVEEDIASHGIEKVNQLGVFSAFALIVGTQIGTGIFSSPAQVDTHVPSPGAAMAVWVVAGLIGWTGAASFAELGAAIPRNGGMQEYLGYIYGDSLAVIMSWTWIVAVKPSAMAIQALVFAEYWTSAIFAASSKTVWLDKILAISSLGVIVLVNTIHVAASTRLTNFLVFPKLSTVLLVVVLAVLVATAGLNWDENGPNSDWRLKSWFAARQVEREGALIDWSKLTSWELMGNYAAALYAGLFAYGGWEQATWVAGEMRNTSRDLPRAIHTAAPTVICGFLLANISYYVILSWDMLGKSDTVAVAAGQKVLGPAGGLLFAVLVSISCVGVLNANVFITGKLTVAAAEKGYLPAVLADFGRDDIPSVASHSHDSGMFKKMDYSIKSLSRRMRTCKTPVAAMIFNAITTCFYIYLGSFRSLVTFIGIAEYAFYLLTVLGSILLRRREPFLTRPYAPALWIPALFCVAAFFLVVRGVIYAPVQGSVLLALITAGVVLHFVKPLELVGRLRG